MMKKTLLLLLLAAPTALAQPRPEWADQSVTQVNREPAVDVTIPSGSLSGTGMPAPEDSPWYLSLNGTWKFHWCKGPDDRPVSFYEPGYDVSGWDEIRVPSNWQIEAARRGMPWDKPLYCNTCYPFAPDRDVQWPNVIQPRPADFTYADMPDPVGSYRRTFIVPDTWAGRDVYIRFNGVEAGYYLWVNGWKVGYSQDSYLPSEFCLTPYLKTGENVLAVEVYRWTDGSYLECQDFWRLSGIFRDVFLWSAPKTQIRNFVFNADLDADYRDATVRLEVEITGRKPAAGTSVRYRLSGADGTVAAEGSVPVKAGVIQVGFSVADPAKWTAETPNLYHLTLSLEEKGKTTDIRKARVGFRKIELAPDGRFLVNGKSVIFKGVNRHDHSAENGHTVSREETETDIRLMKSFNVNAVRTSHYPDNPFFYDLCDEYGIYVLSEANVECHGLWNLSHEMAWADAFAERCANMVRRYRNHASIVIWSLGNESGDGGCLGVAHEAVKALDKSRPTHYCEDDNLCDMTSKMYRPVDELAKVGAERLATYEAGQRVRPHLLCEYAHAMGNAIGNLREYVDTFEAYPALIGGFIWDWVDQGIRMPTPDGKGSYMAVGGDFGDVPNHGNFCANGIIFADRAYAPKALEVKKCYQPVSVRQLANDRYEVTNKRFHSDLSDLGCEYALLRDGRVARKGTLEVNPGPGESVAVSVPSLSLQLEPGADWDLRISFRQRTETAWQGAGYEVAADQFALSRAFRPAYMPEEGSVAVREDTDGFTVSGRGFTAVFSKDSAALSSYRAGGTELLSAPMQFNAFHAPIDNDRGKGLLGGMVQYGMFTLRFEPGTWNVRSDKQKAILSVVNRYTGKEGFGYDVTTEYTVHPDGVILVRSDIRPFLDGISVPRMGFKLKMPASFGRFRWRGRGPFENYADRKEAAFPGVYDALVKDQWIDNIRPQQMGLREDVSWTALTERSGKGLLFVSAAPMAFSALDADEASFFDPADPMKLRHPYEIERGAETVLCLDAAHRGLGNASCGPRQMEKYDLLTSERTFDFLMLPLRRDYTTDELVRKARISVPSRNPDAVLQAEKTDAGVQVSFHCPERGILEELVLDFPGGFAVDWNQVTVNVTGRGAVALQGLATQSLGRHGSAYTRTKVGEASVRRISGKPRLTLKDLDLRMDNGADVVLFFPDAKTSGGSLNASWRLSTPLLPEEHRGALYKVHDPEKVFSASIDLSDIPARPEVNRQHVSIKDFGLKGDGRTDDTEALNRAIASLHAQGGGIMDFAPGTYCLRTVRLKSHVWLHLAEGTVLKAIPGFDEPEDTWFRDFSMNAGSGLLDTAPYDTVDNYMTKQDAGHSFFHNTMFFAEREEDVRIFGKGWITGDDVITTTNDIFGLPMGRRADKMFTFKLCRDVEVGGEDCPADLWYDEEKDLPRYLGAPSEAVENMLRIDHGGHFAILATGTDGIRVHDVYAGADGPTHARDIFDFMECNDVTVYNIYSRANGDDIVKFGSDCSLGFTRPAKGALVRNIVGDTNCNLFQIGSETADDITDVYVDNLFVLATNKAGFSISSNDGGTVRNIYLNSGKTGPLHSRSVMRRVSTPFFVSISNRGRVLGAQVAPYRFMENGVERHELLVTNNPIGRVENVVIRSVDVSEVYAGSSYYNQARWKPYDGSQAEFAPIFAGFKVPDGVDFRLPDGRHTGYIKDVELYDVDITVKGGHPEKDVHAFCPEIGIGKFNIRDLRIQPSYGLWARHVDGFKADRVTVRSERPDPRPAVVLDDVLRADVGGVTEE